MITPDFNSAPHPHPKLIGLSGWATSGKDETANVLVRLYGYERIAFADKLKEFVKAIDPIVGSMPIASGGQGGSGGFVVGGSAGGLGPVAAYYAYGGQGGSGGIVSATRRVNDLVQSLGDTEAKKDAEYRRLLQVIGTSVRDFFGEDTWVKAALPKGASSKYIVISDVRFPNEYDFIRKNHGIVLRVVRPGVQPANNHPSEISLDDRQFDGVIINDGSLVDLEGEVQRVLEDLA